MNRTPTILSQYRLRLHLSLLVVLGCMTVGVLSAQTIRNAEPSKPDTAAINRLLRRAYAYREIQIDSAGILYRQAFKASASAGYKPGMADALSGMGRYFNVRNQQKEAITCLSRAVLYCGNDVRGREQFLSAYLLLSESYYYLGRYDSCAYYRYEALNQMESSHITDPTLRLRVYSKILQFWLNAHADIQNDKYIGHIMHSISELEKEAIAKNDSNLLVNIFFQKEGYYHNIAQNDSARYYGLKNIETGRRRKISPSMIMAAYLNIGLTYLDDKKPDSAIINIEKAVQEAPEQGKSLNRYLIFANIFLGKAYYLRKQFARAIEITLPALKKAEDLHIESITGEAYETLAKAYEETGNPVAAAENWKLYAQAKDSLMKTEKMELGYNLDMKYRIAEKNKELAQKELAIVQNENRIRNKNIWIGCISAGLLLITAISILLYRNSKHKQKLQSEKIYTMQQDMEIKLLKAMINGTEKERSRIARDLHDGIGGTLGSIRAQLGLVYKSHSINGANADFENIMQLLEEASADLRKTAHNLMPEILLQEGLVSATALFCERAARGHALQLRFNSYGEVKNLPAELEMTLYRTIQELVQNILKHAEASHATVQLVFTDTQICLTVEDDGKGLNREDKQSNTGMGLTTIVDRVHSLHGNIDISSAPNQGTSIYIELDIENSKV